MANNNDTTIIKTVGQLKKYIGQVILFSYYSDKTQVTYLKKITKIPTYIGENKISNLTPLKCGVPIYGTHMVVFKPLPNSTQPYVHYLDEERASTYFETVRTPTKQELNAYKTMIRYARIFGLENINSNNKIKFNFFFI